MLEQTHLPLSNKRTALQRLVFESGQTQREAAARLSPPVDSATFSRWATDKEYIPPARRVQLAHLFSGLLSIDYETTLEMLGGDGLLGYSPESAEVEP